MEELEKNGVTIMRNIYNAEQIVKFQEKFEKEWENLSKNFETAEWKIIDYKDKNTETFFLDKILYQGKKISYIIGNKVIDLGNGRYEFDSSLNLQLFLTEEIKQIIDHFLERNYTAIIGGLPVFSQTNNGLWHRDIGSLFENEDLDLILPPFYMTIIIPLTDIKIGNGATEFVRGSHKINLKKFGITSNEKLGEWADKADKFAAEMNAGDVCIFNGKILHRGTCNISSKPRNAFYIVFRKNWYSDDDPNDYNLI